MAHRLKKDIVIPAGTLFGQAPSKSSFHPDTVSHTIGLTKDSCGMLTYDIGEDPALSDWFEEV